MHAMEDARSQADNTEMKFEHTAELLAEVSGDIRSISERNRSFAETASFQHSMVIDVNQHMQSISMDSNKLAEGSGQIVSLSRSLNTQAGKLKELVNQFKH